jgi:predicted ABC-type ATPase
MNKRIRIFAGPNGSGKSTIINRIRNYKVNDERALDFGIYINADDIAQKLQTGSISFNEYEIEFDLKEFKQIVSDSGLLNEHLTFQQLLDGIVISNNEVAVTDKNTSHSQLFIERFAQILADYLRAKLLLLEKKFSFETVFSHKGKVDFIQKAKDSGYKVYLYFVATEDPEINIYRVKQVRVQQHGHDVPEDKIVSRYYRSLDLLHSAAQHCYQVYFFDNSSDATDDVMFAHFKKNALGEKEWDPIDETIVPQWFYKYYSDKNT